MIAAWWFFLRPHIPAQETTGPLHPIQKAFLFSMLFPMFVIARVLKLDQMLGEPAGGGGRRE